MRIRQALGLFPVVAGLLLAALLMLTEAPSLPAPAPFATNDFYVNTGTGNDSNDGTAATVGGGHGPKKTIAAGISAATINGNITIVHVADGTYPTGLDVTKSGTSLAVPLILQCDNGLVAGNIASGWQAKGHCKITGGGFAILTENANFQVLGFDIGGNGGMNVAIDYACPSTGGSGFANCPSGPNLRFAGNYIHDLGQTFTANGFLGCIDAGAINHLGRGYIDQNIVIESNVILNVGKWPTPTGGNCAWAIDLDGWEIVRDNVIIGMSTGGIGSHASCHMNWQNNLVMKTNIAYVPNRSLAGTYCPNGPGDNIFANNYSGAISGSGHYFKTGGVNDCSSGHHSVYSHNITDGVGNDYNPALDATCDDFTPATGCSATHTCASSTSTTSFMVNPTTDGLGNYHLAAGSPGIGAGIQTTGSPVYDLEGVIRSSTPSVGPHEFAGVTGTPHLDTTGINFGSLNVGSVSAPQTITFTNSAPTSVTVSAITSSNAAEFPTFSKDFCTGRVIAAGGTCTDQVVFQPTAVGARSSTLSVTGTGFIAINIPLSGVGTSVGLPSFDLATFDFGSVAVGGSAQRSFTFLNPTNGNALTSLVLALTGGTDYHIFVNACGSTLATNLGCNVTVIFQPTGTGTKTDTLSGTSSATNVPTIALTGVGTSAPTPGGNPQTNDVTGGQPVYRINAQWVNGIAPGYKPQSGGGLVLQLSQGSANCSGTTRGYGGGTLTMTNNTTNYVYLNTASNCVPATSTSAPACTAPHIAEVTTSGGAITAILDTRSMFNYCP